jgi:type III secretion protein Q
VKLSPVRRLTRAQLALGRKGALVAQLREALGPLAAHLASALAVPVELDARLTDATLAPLQTLANHGTFFVLELHGEALAVLELDRTTVGALIAHAAGAPTSAGVPTRLTRIEEAALGWLVLSVLSTANGLEATRRFAPRLVSMHGDRAQVLQAVEARRRHLAVSLSLTIGEVRGTGRLIVPSTWLETMLEAQPDEPLPACQQPVLDAQLEATALVGLMNLTRAEARALDVGDVLVFPGLTAEGTSLRGPGRLTLPTLHLRGAFGPEGFTLTAQEPTMKIDDPSLPVDVEVELTRLRLPLHQLGVIAPGTVIPLHLTAAQTVVLRIGDRAVAKAELVEVEGEIGARILSLV